MWAAQRTRDILGRACGGGGVELGQWNLIWLVLTSTWYKLESLGKRVLTRNYNRLPMGMSMGGPALNMYSTIFIG